MNDSEKKQFSYSGFEPKISYAIRDYNYEESFEGNAAEVAFACCTLAGIKLYIESEKLYAEFRDSERQFIADMNITLSQDLESAFALFFYEYLAKHSQDYTIKEILF